MQFEENVIQEEQFARDTLERYVGCPAESFCSSLLLTNFPRYVEHYAKTRKVDLIEGSMFKVAHNRKEDVSILDFKIGSPAAALVIFFICFIIKNSQDIFSYLCGTSIG